jgi:hypothetical protein
MMIRDRVRELRRVRGRDLAPNPRNWRTHPPEQLAALRGVLADVGFAGAALAYDSGHSRPMPGRGVSLGDAPAAS